MKFSFSWLKEWVEITHSAEDLAHILTMGGMEIESLTPAAPPFSGVVVGKIIEAVQHPNADRLRVCTVDIGQSEPLQIVCGAPNARVGIVVPCAQVGAVLPGDFKIGKAKMRGVESFGMLCSGKELGVSVEAEGLWELPLNLTIGKDVRDVMSLDDVVFEIKLTPNLGHCMSMQGIAREVAALTGGQLKPFNIIAPQVKLNEILPVHIHAIDLCGRFTGRIIRNVNATAITPDWMLQRLERAGQRSISALVDISNYVLLALGRPTHVFDLAKIEGDLQVRWGKTGESLTLLNDQSITLENDVGVLADNKGALSLAGIMGGASSAVSDETRDVYVEAAFWWPEALMGRARRYQLSTDASQRFERGVDAQSIPAHLEYISQLIVDICGGDVAVMNDQIIRLPAEETVSVRLDRARKVIGIALSLEQMEQVFIKLGMHHKRLPNDTLSVHVPSYRFDIRIEADLIEEIARLIGYDNIPAMMPRDQLQYKAQSETQISMHDWRKRIAGLGYHETVNYGFTDPQLQQKIDINIDQNASSIRLQNPLAIGLSVMRSSLWGGLIQSLQTNLQRKQNRVRLFEIGRVFYRDETVKDGDLSIAGVAQPKKLAGLIYGGAQPEQWANQGAHVVRSFDFFDIKADVENLLGHLEGLGGLDFVKAEHAALHPGRCARVEHNGKVLGWLGEMHPKLVQELDLPANNQAPLMFELDVDLISTRVLAQTQNLSVMPPVQRDLALIVPKTLTYHQVEHVMKSYAQQHIDVPMQSVSLFDRYAGDHVPEGFVSLAFRLILQDMEKTLEDAAVDAWVAGLLAKLKEQGVSLR